MKSEFDLVGIANKEPEFLATVRRLKVIGYGRMIQMIQDEWMEFNKKQYGISDRCAVHDWLPKYEKLELALKAMFNQTEGNAKLLMLRELQEMLERK